jgi:hypothetical protein
MEEDEYAGLVHDIADDEEGLESSEDELLYDLADEGVALLQQQHDCVSDLYLQALTGQQVRHAIPHNAPLSLPRRVAFRRGR